MDSNRLRSIILKLQDHLTNDDRKRLHFYLGNDVPRSIEDDSTLSGTLDLMDSLFDQDKINEEDFTLLINAFDQIRCLDAVRVLRGDFSFLVALLLFSVNLEHLRKNQSIESLVLIMPPLIGHRFQDKDEDSLVTEHRSSTFKLNIYQNTTWTQNGFTVAGGNGQGNGLNQLNHPTGIYVDNYQTIYVADAGNDRIVEWKFGATNGQVVAGGNGKGNQMNQLNYPRDVIVDKETNSFIICDSENRRVVRWGRRNGTHGQTIISDIDCYGLTMDYNRYLYVSDDKKHEVRRWKMNDNGGTLVAGGNGKGDLLNQLSSPTFISVDEDNSVYVSDWNNHRVMKWMEGAKEGIVVGGGSGAGNNLTQLSGPEGVIVDRLSTVYVADWYNHRVMRRYNGATQGNIVVGGNEQGEQKKQLTHPIGLSFDLEGNLYVVDNANHRIQRFNIDQS